MAKALIDSNFLVRQKGLDYEKATSDDPSQFRGAIVGFAEKEQAEADVTTRNQRAKDLCVDAEYEVVQGRK